MGYSCSNVQGTGCTCTTGTGSYTRTCLHGRDFSNVGFYFLAFQRKIISKTGAEVGVLEPLVVTVTMAVAGRASDRQFGISPGKTLPLRARSACFLIGAFFLILRVFRRILQASSALRSCLVVFTHRPVILCTISSSTLLRLKTPIDPSFFSLLQGASKSALSAGWAA